MVIVMKKLIKQKIIVYLFFLLILSIFIGIYSFLIYTNKINSDRKTINMHSFVIGVILFLILGIISGNIAQKNGLLEGLIASLIIILISLIINFIIDVPFINKNFIKTITYLVSSSAGGIIGVNIKPIIKINSEHV